MRTHTYKPADVITVAHSDSELVALARGGNDSAFAELYQRYAAKMYRFCLTKTADVRTAEDLTSELFLKVVKNLHRYDERGVPFEAFLYKIARNTVIDHTRRRRPENSLEEDAPEVVGSVNTENEVENLDLNRYLLAALAQLKAEHREVLVLRFVEGREAEDVGRLLGKSERAIRSIQVRAVRRLREIVEQSGQPELLAYIKGRA